MSDLCIACCKVVGKRQHGITCDVCDRWQHRICGTGITREQYFTALRGGEEIKFVCEPCVARIPPRDNDGVEVGVEAVEMLLEDAAENDENATAAFEEHEVTFQLGSLQNSRSSLLPLAESTSQIPDDASDLHDTEMRNMDAMDVSSGYEASTEDSTETATETETLVETDDTDRELEDYRRNAFSTATSLELDDDFDVSVQTDNNRTMNASFNISTNIESQEEITENSMIDESLSTSVLSDEPLTFHVFEQGPVFGRGHIHCKIA